MRNFQIPTVKHKVVLQGCGYWGKIILKTFAKLPDVEVVATIDPDPAHEFNQRPGHYATADDLLRAMPNGNEFDTVFICTPAWLHFEHAHFWLERGKNCFIEKPMTMRHSDSLTLLNLAQRSVKQIGVDNTFVFSNEVRYLRDLIQYKYLGRLHSIKMVRSNFGPFFTQTDVAWDLLPHDLSILDFVLGKPKYVSATGAANTNPNVLDDVRATFWYPNDVKAEVEVSWLNPDKQRLIKAIGNKRIFQFNGTDENETFLFDNNSKEKITIVMGEMAESPLELEISNFLESLNGGDTPLADGFHGAAIVRQIEGVVQSIKNRGMMVSL